MQKVVIFAEKPSHVVSYCEALGIVRKTKFGAIVPPSDILPHGAEIVCAIGHLVELAEPKMYDEKWAKWDMNTLPIYPQTIKLVAKDEHKERLAHMKKVFHEADVIYHCGDIDREGDNVFGSILQYCGLNFNSKPIKRLWFNSLEKVELLKAFRNLKEVDVIIPTFNEAKARQIGDWLVGMSATR